jgi:L-amino acid N-acyltransferase YncA
MEDVTINLAHTDDIEHCALIDKQMGVDTPASLWQQAVHEGRVLIATMHAHVVGYLRYGYLWDGELPYIQLIRVEPISRQQGVGKKLIRALEDILKQQGMHYLLSSTEASNSNSLLFHQALGFQECGKLDINQDGTLEIFLKKTIT